MARMVELIRQGQAPESIRRRAAQGALSLAPEEAVEILVALMADRDLGAEAEQTLADWDEASLVQVVASEETSAAVLSHLVRTRAASPVIVQALCENPKLPPEELEPIVASAGPDVLQAMLHSPRVRASSRLLELIASNPASEPARVTLEKWADAARQGEVESVVESFMTRHADEVAREDRQPFALTAGPEDEEDPLNSLLKRAQKGEAVSEPEEQKQLSLLQKIGRLRVGERIKLAVRGNREERMILIRDRSKLVSLAVLESPKVNDAEMEGFASMKNLQETVLRTIATKRSCIKNYGVLRALVNNPKLPLDVALPLMPHLLVKDLRGLAVNKNVNETVRKLALRMFRAKTTRKKD